MNVPLALIIRSVLVHELPTALRLVLEPLPLIYISVHMGEFTEPLRLAVVNWLASLVRSPPPCLHLASTSSGHCHYTLHTGK